MNKYVVWSLHVNDAGEQREVIEVTRSDRKVAEEDVALIGSILHRKAWVQEAA
jgi:hypothetical protein